MRSKLSILITCLILGLLFPWTVQSARLSSAQDADQKSRFSETRVTIDFRDVDVRVVAKFISELTGTNFVFDKSVRDKVTVYSPTKVSPEEAYRLFETVLKIHGYTTVPTNGLVKIIPSQKARTTDVETRKRLPEPSRARDDRVVTQLIRLQHADPTEMRTLLQPLIEKTGSLIAYDSGNTLIVTDYASNINRLLSIISAVDMEDEGTKLSVIRLEHASARDTATELQAVMKSSTVQVRGKTVSRSRDMYTVVPDERTNSLIVMARSGETRMIQNIVAELDTPTPRGSDRIHVYFLKNAVAEDLAQTLQDLTGKLGGSTTKKEGGPARLVLQEDVFITADKPTNALVIRAERQDFLLLRTIIEKLDIQRSQVLVEGVIMEMSLTKANEFGAEWRLLNFPEEGDSLSAFGGTNLPGQSSQGLINQVASNPLAGASGLILGAAEGTISFGGSTFLNLGLLIQALQQDSDVNILSTPKLLTMDNEEASIVVGQERPFLQSSQTSATATTTATVTNTYEFKDLGLTLKITPHITQGEYIKLKIFQQLKSFIDEAETGAVSSTKRETETSVLVQNRETVVIGGLITDEGRETKSQVPCLGNIPVLGWAFKRRSRSSDKLNLLILIKPTIIRTAEELRELTDEKRKEMEPSEEEKQRRKKPDLPETLMKTFGE